MEETGLKTINLLFFLLLTYLTFLNTPLVVGVPPSLNLTVNTDKSVYLQEESIKVSGTLSVESVGFNPIRQWPVGVSINLPNGTSLLFATPETDQDGNFAMTFNLPPETESGTYTILSSVQWNNQHAIREVPFEIRPTEQIGGFQPQVPQEPRPSSPILLTFIATGVAFITVISALIFYGVVAFQKKTKTPVAPVTPTTPVTKADITRYKKCAKCGKTFLELRTFCPYCFKYHGKNGYIEKTTV